MASYHWPDCRVGKARHPRQGRVEAYSYDTCLHYQAWPKHFLDNLCRNALGIALRWLMSPRVDTTSPKKAVKAKQSKSCRQTQPQRSAKAEYHT